jgi:hypothetical protein
VATAESEPPLARETLSLSDAVARGAVSVRARGAGVQHTTLEVTAHASVDLVIPAGTFFRADANVQNMVVMKTATARLDRGKTQTLTLATACASFHRAAPSTSDRLELAVADPALQRLAVCLEHQTIDDGRKQMLVWKLTDGVEREQAMQRRDHLRPYLLDACEKKLGQKRHRCARIVEATYEVLVDKLLAHRAQDEQICGVSGR